jgi:hypothetical protein
MRLYILSALVFVSAATIAQKKSITILENHGKIAITQEYYNEHYKDNILKADKYLDATEDIKVICGTDTFSRPTATQLASGYAFSPIGGKGGIHVTGIDFNRIMTLKLVKGKLKISCDVYGFDGKRIAMVRENKLTTSNKHCDLDASDKYFELFDEDYIPVLQIELQRKTNSIYIGGAFCFDSGYVLISKDDGMYMRPYNRSIMTIPRPMRDSLFYDYKRRAKKIQLIHEN